MATLAAELHEAGLDAWHDSDPAASLPTVLSWSYAALSREQATVFGLVGIAPGPDIGLPAAASLIGEPAYRTQIKLRQLEQASLLSRDARSRYRMHDLVRRYATDYAARDLAEADRQAALRRVVDYYLHTAHTGDRLLAPHRERIQLDSPAPGAHPLPLTDRAAAMAWFDTEHPCLLTAQQMAVDHGWHQAVWQTAWVLATFHARRGHLDDDLAVDRAGLAAANHLADPTTQTSVHWLLGRAHARLSQHSEAHAHFHTALTLATDNHDRPGQAHTHRALGCLWELRGDNRRALEHATQAVHLFQALNTPVWEAAALNNLGWYTARLGDYNHARAHCQAALTLFHRHHEREGEAATLDSLGYIAHHAGHPTEAITHYQQALTLYRNLGHTYEAANTLDRLGHLRIALGHPKQARTAWQAALQLYQAQHRTTDTNRLQQQLDTLAASKKPG